MACPKVVKCPLFPELEMKSGLKIWKTLFCENDGNFDNCERFRMSEAGQMPHPRMLPNGKQLHDEIGD